MIYYKSMFIYQIIYYESSVYYVSITTIYYYRLELIIYYGYYYCYLAPPNKVKQMGKQKRKMQQPLTH